MTGETIGFFCKNVLYDKQTICKYLVANLWMGQLADLITYSHFEFYAKKMKTQIISMLQRHF
jgi:hypothetical protein